MTSAETGQLGRVAIVTGGSRGIGLEIARGLGARSWRVCITGRKPDVLDAARADLESAGVEVLAVAGGAHDAEHQQAAVAAVLERWGRIDALVNNAAMSPFLGPMIEAPPEKVLRGIEVNLVAPLAWTQLVWQQWMRDHGGCVVNIASVGGTYPVPRVGAYNVSKAALIHLTRQLALELAPGVRVNGLAPATIKTDFSKAKYDGREEEVAKQYPLGRLGTPEEVAEIAVLLCDGPFEWVTGQTIVIDGGASQVVGVV